MAVYNFGFYNVEESRPASLTHPEIRAQLGHGAIGALGLVGGGPLDALALAEMVGNTCPTVDGYRRIRSLKTPGRSNLACYVRRDVYARHRWVQQTLTWTRPRHPELPRHPARAILVVTLKDGTLLVVNHFPERPIGPRPEELVAARHEYQQDLIRILAPWTSPEFRTRSQAYQRAELQRARIVLGDQNARPRDELLRTIAEEADVRWHGQGVDLVGRHRAELLGDVVYFHEVAHVEKGSDHGHALSASFRV